MSHLFSLEVAGSEGVPIVPQLLHVHQILRDQRRVFGGVRRQVYTECRWGRSWGAMRLIRKLFQNAAIQHTI